MYCINSRLFDMWALITLTYFQNKFSPLPGFEPGTPRWEADDIPMCHHASFHFTDFCLHVSHATNVMNLRNLINLIIKT